ncbi:MAG TPA: c-type cytochrome [Thermoanaerobaculia bacterium]|nr:c-type cytochrome [Thermoanaerobaculia bacterium]
MGKTMASAGNRVAVLLVALLVAACAAVSQQKAQAPRADNLEFHNLRVLPPNITHDELIATMRGFARSLGVKCNHCHVANPPGTKPEFDFPSDAKPEKKIARTMIVMARNINSNYISKLPVEGEEHSPNVTCYTCHRGHVTPETTLPPEPPREPQPAPQPPPQPQT